MIKQFLWFIFLNITCTITLAQPSLREVNQYLPGDWEGNLIVTGKSKDLFKDTVHVEFYINCLLSLKHDGTYDIQLISTHSVKVIEPKNLTDPTIKNLLEAKDSYKLFITNNRIKTLRYGTFPPRDKNPILDLELEIKPDSHGDRLTYLIDDLKTIEIAAIAKKKMTLRIPTRSNWDEKQRRYLLVKYIPLEFIKLDKP